MAIHKQGIHGGFKGRVGNVVGSTWKGLDVMKIRPASVANPNTVRQQDQRSRFGLLMRFLSAQSRLIQIGFRPYAVKMTSINAALSYNIAAAITGEFPDYLIDYSKVLLSKGDLPAMSQAVLSYTDPVSVKLAWTDNSSYQGAHASDLLNVSVYDPISNKALSFVSCATRTDATITLALPAEWTGLSVEVFAFFLSEEGVASANAKSLISDTLYAGSIVLEQA